MMDILLEVSYICHIHEGWFYQKGDDADTCRCDKGGKNKKDEEDDQHPLSKKLKIKPSAVS